MFKDYTGIPPRPGIEDLICVDPSADPAAWPFDIPYSSVVLFEAMPLSFTLEELFARGEMEGHTARRCVEFLRTYELQGMVRTCGEQIEKTGEKPYF